MSLTNIKLKSQAERGFTIVELLIVVVVIAILAAITIVSYNGITNRANQSASKSAASNVQKKVELFQGEVGNYPYAKSLLNDSTKAYNLPSGYGDTAPTADGTNKGTGYVQLLACAPTGTTSATLSASNITGMRIIYWTYGADGTSPSAVEFVTLGQCPGSGLNNIALRATA